MSLERVRTAAPNHHLELALLGPCALRLQVPLEIAPSRVIVGSVDCSSGSTDFCSQLRSAVTAWACVKWVSCLQVITHLMLCLFFLSSLCFSWALAPFPVWRVTRFVQKKKTVQVYPAQAKNRRQSQWPQGGATVSK